MNTPTDKQRADAENIDAEEHGDDPLEHLDEYRFWRSPHGRQVQAYEDFESGRY